MNNPLSFFMSTLLVAAGLTLSACAPGFNSSSDSASGGSNQNQAAGGDDPHNGTPVTPTPVDTSKDWATVSDGTNGKVDGGSSDGSLVVQVDKEHQSLVLILPLPPIFMGSIVGVQIPQMPGASVQMVPQDDGSAALGVVIPLKYIVRGGQFGSYGTLPNGDPVPFMPAGEVHGFAVDFPQSAHYRLHFYLAVNAAAVFVETPDWKFSGGVGFLPTIGFPVKNSAKTQVNGYFAIVPDRGNFASGVYVASRIPNSAAALIDQLLRF